MKTSTQKNKDEAVIKRDKLLRNEVRNNVERMIGRRKLCESKVRKKNETKYYDDK